jgi:hypothetical protein
MPPIDIPITCTEVRPSAVIKAASLNMSVLSPELLADALEDPGPQGERARRLADARIQETKRAEFHALDLVLDLGYERSPIVAADQRARGPGGQLPGRARPGARLPHAWLAQGRSLYDELGPDMTLLVLADGREAEAERLAAAAQAVGVPLRVLRLAGQRLEGYGADLLLVRPDQHIAWLGDVSPLAPDRLFELVRGAPINDHLLSF